MNKKDYSVTAIIFAGGVGTRMHSKDLPKQFLRIHGKPIIAWTIGVFQRCKSVDNIVVSCNEEWIDYCQTIVAEYNLDKVRTIVPGGKTGQLSIYSGLRSAADYSETASTIVLIHDGVRPLINEETVVRNVDSVVNYGSSITCVKAKETILRQSDDGIEIIPRESVLLARAPQGFILSDILTAHEDAREAGRFDYVDSASLMKAYGHPLHIIEGPDENIKITTQDDYYSMRAILDSQENNQLYSDRL